MNKKILIGAGILLTVFIVFLIVICGASGGNKTLSQDELKEVTPTVVCETKDGNKISYDITLLTNSTEFDAEILSRNYSKITINKNSNFKTYGLTFRLKTEGDSTLNISLMKNDELLSSKEVKAEEGIIESVNLILENCVEIATTDSFSIVITNSADTNFVFDTLIFYFEEV